MLDLLPAGGAVRDDDGVRPCPPHGRQQRQLAHGQRHIVSLRLVAERAGHAAAGRSDRLHLEAGHELQRCFHRANGGEGLLVAMPVQISRPLKRL